MKGRYKDMTYKEFHDNLIGEATDRQIAVLQEVAFMKYESVHGYRPKRKEEKRIAYSMLYEKLK